jgi:ATP-dependent Clp protease ATP-binding subunit ClpB
MKDLATEALRQHFRPEFLNRIDDVVFFHGLGHAEIAQILDIQLRAVSSLLGERDLKMEVTEKAKTKLADLGYDPKFGARPLKRTVQRELQNPLASAILRGDFVAGDTIRVEIDANGLVFEKMQP